MLPSGRLEEKYKKSPRLTAFYTKKEFDNLVQCCGFEILKSWVEDVGTVWLNLFATK